MTEQEAHDQLHDVLPSGATVTLSRSQWSRSTVGGPVYHTADGDWHVTVTIPDEVDRVEAVFAATLEEAMGKMMQALNHSMPQSKPSKLAAPSVSEQRQQRREVS
jgi:hypothetical protein